jgi:hypothetical protein
MFQMFSSSSNAKFVECDEDSTLVITNGNKLKCFGNSNGQCGIENAIDMSAALNSACFKMLSSKLPEKESKKSQRKFAWEETCHFSPDSQLFYDFQPFQPFRVYLLPLFTDSRCFLFSSSLEPLHFVAKCSELKICFDLLEVDFEGQ